MATQQEQKGVAAEALHEVARDVHVDQGVVAALDDEEGWRPLGNAVIGRHLLVEGDVLLEGQLHDAMLEQ